MIYNKNMMIHLHYLLEHKLWVETRQVKGEETETANVSELEAWWLTAIVG